jgi:glycosyltransferase involved in cell wall biosynthesis
VSRARDGVSVAMIATDEVDRLPRALRSVAWADEVVLVDGGSRDRTAAVAREMGARVLETESPWPGYAAQRRRAIEAAGGPWILVLDADEEVTPELAEEIRKVASRPEGSGPPGASAGGPAGYEILFHTRYLGHWFGRRGWYRERHLRLARKESLRVTERRVHEGLEVTGPVGRLHHPIRHYSYRSVEHHQAKMAEYARLKARDLRERGRRAGLASACGHALGRLLGGYLLQGRFLDGWPGLVHEMLAAQASLLAYLELWELGREGPDLD